MVLTLIDYLSLHDEACHPYDRHTKVWAATSLDIGYRMGAAEQGLSSKRFAYSNGIGCFQNFEVGSSWEPAGDFNYRSWAVLSSTY